MSRMSNIDVLETQLRKEQESHGVTRAMLRLAESRINNCALTLTVNECEALQDMLSIDWGNKEETAHAANFHRRLTDYLATQND